MAEHENCASGCCASRGPIEGPIDPETIYRVYSGKPGCGCGCNGTYWEDDRNIRRIVKKINARIGDGASVQATGEGRAFCYFVEDDRRYLWAYARA